MSTNLAELRARPGARKATLARRVGSGDGSFFGGGDGGLGFGLQAKTLYSKVPALCVWGGREGGET